MITHIWMLMLTYLNYVHTVRIHDVHTHTVYGQLKGYRQQQQYSLEKGAVTDTVDVYLGIPYAKPPVGSRRFKTPEKPDSWEGSRDATSAGPVCPQQVYYSQTIPQHQDEDCLNLNIYAPYQQDDTQRYAVMMFLHGGSYEEGAGIRYDGSILAQHGVVVVTINYRLAALGYLTSGDEHLPGNYGFQDQIQALLWLSENIDNFRGDPSRITLFGSSAGSSSVGLMLLTPSVSGMFHRAIMQSGSPLAFWAVYNATVNHHNFIKEVARKLDCPTRDWHHILECLKTAPYTNYTDQHWEFPRIVPSDLNFKPLVDGSVLPGFPSDLFREGRFSKVPVMLGVVEDEWARSMGWFFRDLDAESIDKNFTDGFDRASLVKSVNHVIKERFWWPQHVADVVLHAYTDWTRLHDPMANRNAYKQFMSDFAMVAPTVSLGRQLAGHNIPVWMYRFNQRPPHTRDSWWGCYHSVELDYVFGSPYTGYDIATDAHIDYSDADRDVSSIVMNMWSDFAKHGNPTPNVTIKNNMTWNTLDPTHANYLYLSQDQISMKEHFKADKVHLLTQLLGELLVVSPWESQVVSCVDCGDHHGVGALCWVLMALCLLLLIVLAGAVYKLVEQNSCHNQRHQRARSCDNNKPQNV